MVSGIPNNGRFKICADRVQFGRAQAFLQAEKLGESETWYCGRCKAHVQAQKKLDMWRLPEVMVVLIKRFEHTRGGRVKLDAPVSFPLQGLDLAPYLAHAQACPAVSAGVLATWWSPSGRRMHDDVMLSLQVAQVLCSRLYMRADPWHSKPYILRCTLRANNAWGMMSGYALLPGVSGVRHLSSALRTIPHAPCTSAGGAAHV